MFCISRAGAAAAAMAIIALCRIQSSHCVLQYGAKIVLGGHNHYYSRGLVSGIHHLTSGGGGAGLVTPLMGQPNIVYPPNNTVSKVLNCTKVEVVGNTLTATTINASTGTVLDTFTVTP